jgi:hypothetical protein
LIATIRDERQPARVKLCHAISIIAFFCLFTSPCLADSAYSTYAFGNLFVFDSLSADGSRKLNVVSLEDDSSLKVTGQVSMPGNSSYISAYSSLQDKLMVLRWDRLEIYDLANPSRPVFLRAFELKNQGFSSPGFPFIQRTAENRFLVVNAVNTTDLRTEGDVLHWTVSPIAINPEIKSKMSQRPPTADFESQAQPVMLVKESARYRFELFWKEARRPGVITHRKYLRKVDKISGRIVASLPLGLTQETID